MTFEGRVIKIALAGCSVSLFHRVKSGSVNNRPRAWPAINPKSIPCH